MSNDNEARGTQNAERDSSRPNFPQMEEEILAFWQKERIFERSIEERPENKTYVFYDGPPFANGLPHYGHLLQSIIKDCVPRYWTMQGFRVPRRWGWDCHGLPAENLVEKTLKLNSRRDIETYGIDKFNQACATSVMQYAGEWKKYVDRVGRWVEFDNAYKTMDASYTESVWWAFSELWKKDLVYRDLRVSLYCPRCSTPLSSFEIAMQNSYLDAKDPAVTLKFKLKGEDKTYFLAWTTTPWTLLANVALAVNPDEMYVRVKMEETGEIFIMAESLMESVLKQYYPLSDNDPSFEVLEKVKGSSLEGLKYEPLFDLSPEALEKLTARAGKNIYTVVAMGYVTTSDGTGIVHTAPAFGEEDFLASKTHDLPVVVTVDEEGKQKPETGKFAGMYIKDSNAPVTEDLRARGLLYREEEIEHSVPACWRCNTLLFYKAQPAWFVNVTKIKPKMLETAKKIGWYPETFKTGRFGNGLETAPDWNISRTRYWGSPLPVWVCDACGEKRVFGSVAELEHASGQKLGEGGKLDLHRPYIDEITVPCACGQTMRRIPEVFDCWFESGSMPYASVHYPQENKQWFEDNYPADFIAEAQDQTRGWFYTLHVLSSALFNKPAFKNVIVTGMILAEDGKKMSKSLKNYPDPWDLMQRLGADTLRFYLLSSPVLQADSVNFSEKDCAIIQRTLFGTLWNILAFYKLYAAEGHPEIVKPRSMHALDRWLASRLAQVTREMTAGMEGYDLVGASRPLRAWVDDLSTWWLRRSRERMKGADQYDRQDALRTLREALLETAKLMAPFTPFFADKLYQEVGGPKMSVHLDKWPKVDERISDEQLLKDMEWVREVAAAGQELRARHKIPVRQALAALTVNMRDASLAARLTSRTELTNLIRDELNVEQVLVKGGSEVGDQPWIAELDTVITPELKKKGLARELSRHVMNLRKKLGLTPKDGISLNVASSDLGLRDTIEAFLPGIVDSFHATAHGVGEVLPEGMDMAENVRLDEQEISIGISKV
ncbi:isoleucine--tRNA ligase [Candidatus Uhrbacteria bacterium]|nr:isoleucine--tRNA ligase [Candidatus Uhrbacteria bacterium]